jgi:dienelactone hydrolase
MPLRTFALILLALCRGEAPAVRELHTEAVEYKHGDVVLEGWLAYEKGVPGKRPGVILVHEWKGHGPYVRQRAEQIARLGYVAFAIDMYGKGVFAKDHEEAGKLSGVFHKDRKLMRERAAAGLERLKKVEAVDPSKIAAMGYCFGGTTVLELARGGYDVLGVASFHGGLSSPVAEAKPIKAKVAVFHGALDRHVPPEQVTAFGEEMKNAGADWFLVSFGNAVHSFTVKEAGDDPSKGMAYNAEADRRSWDMLKSFLAEVLKPADR